MKQPGRAINKDFDRCTITDFLDKLLDRGNCHFYKEVEGRPLIAPKWSYCLSYEAIRICKERSLGIKEALWKVLGDMEHRKSQCS